MTQKKHRRVADTVETTGSGMLVVALFGWFVLSACGDFLGGGTPNLVGNDSIGVFKCDAEGHYGGTVGGNTPSANDEEYIRNTLNGRLASAKNSREDAERSLATKCPGGAKPKSAYDREYGCDRAAVAEVDGLKSQLGPYQREYGSSIFSPASKTKAEAERHDTRLAEKRRLENELDAAQYRSRAALVGCNRADMAANDDPCWDRHKENAEAMRSQAAAEERSREAEYNRFKKCMDDRKKQAQGVGRTTIPPEMIPGILGGIRASPRSSPAPQPSSPTPSHKH